MAADDLTELARLAGIPVEALLGDDDAAATHAPLPDGPEQPLGPEVEALLAAALRDEVADQPHPAAPTPGGAPPRPPGGPQHVAEMNAREPATDRVRAMADAAGIYLSSVTGTGVAGRITPADVQAQVQARAPQRGQLTAVASAGRYPHPTAAAVNEKASWPGWLAAARATGPEPTLFATGNLPPFTASGIDVNELMGVPWPARPAMATAPTRAAALAILQAAHDDQYASHHSHAPADGREATAEHNAMTMFGDHEPVWVYLQAVDRWLENGQHAAQLAEHEASRQRWLEAMRAKGRTDV